MNKVILIGRLTRDPELRTTPSNLSVATFSIAVTRPFSPQNGGSPEADFINCVVWRRQAENLAKYCHKGSQIAVEGRIQTRNYTGQDGAKRYVTEVMCDNITFLGSKDSNQGNGGFMPDNYQTGASYPESSNYQVPASEVASMPTTDISEDPFKDFGEEITLSDDDLPF
ncbi:MAG: single-stranded DNA-binding protein [Bacilli bacterium]|nr:single-stranded DNA-binding protein [Bacilli bacterium]